MVNKVKFTMKGTPDGLSQVNSVVLDTNYNKIWSGVKSVTGNTVELEIGNAGTDGQNVWVYGNNSVSGSESLASVFGGYSLIESSGELQQYDTIVGVGASITQGMFDGKYFETPFRGVNFATSSTGGATLQNIIDNVQSFIDLASGRTLFIMHAGGNDCTGLTSAGGTGDGATGSVIDYLSIEQSNRDATEARYRQLIGLLKPHGDLAIANLTFRDYKGQVLPLQDPSSVGSGSWNNELLEPLIQELSPEWYSNGSPVFDYYNTVLSNPDILDVDDNVHMYDDRTYVPIDTGYPSGIGSKTIRDYMIKTLGKVGAIPSTPFDSPLYNNRVRINIGNTIGVVNRPFYNGEDNNVAIENATLTPTNLVSYDDSKLTVTPVLSLNTTENGFSSRINLDTNFLPFSEGLLDGNALASSISCPNSETFELKITNIGKGKISLAGLRQTTARDDSSYMTQYTIIDDNGSTSKTAGSSWDSTSPDPFDQFAEFEYDTTISGELTISISGVGSNGFGYISVINIDIE